MPAATIDEYLAGVPEDKRLVLARLRAQIRLAAPEAIEAISYGMPAFKLGGRYFVGFAAAKAYCSFYVGHGPLEACADDLAGYRLWKGTVNFPTDRPLPGELVSRLIEVRLADFRAP